METGYAVGAELFAGQISLMVCERKGTTVSKTLWSSFSYGATQPLSVSGRCLAWNSSWSSVVGSLAVMNTPQLPTHFPTELGALVLQEGWRTPWNEEVKTGGFSLPALRKSSWRVLMQPFPLTRSLISETCIVEGLEQTPPPW